MVGSVLLFGFLNTAMGQLSPRQTYPRNTKQQATLPSRQIATTPAEAKYLYVLPKEPTPVYLVVNAKPDKLSALLQIHCDNCQWTIDKWTISGVGLNADGTFTGTGPDKVGQVLVANVTNTAGTGVNPTTGQSANVAAGTTSVQFLVVPANDAPLIVTNVLPTVVVGEAINQPLEIIQGPTQPGGYQWTIDPTTLPPGLTSFAQPDPKTRKMTTYISGTPTQAGKTVFKVSVLDSNGKQASANIASEVDALPGCGTPRYADLGFFNRWYVPLSRSDYPSIKNDGSKQLPTDSDVQCFYSTTGYVAKLTQVQYLYGFGGGANTLSADMVSFQLFAPIATQIAVGTSVTGGGTNGASSTPNGNAALQSVEAGGDLYFHVLYPLANYQNNRISTVAALDPKFGFSFNGFANQSTLSQANEQYFNAPIAANFSVNGIANAGGLFADYRGGLQSVPGPFARQAGLSQHNFFLQQFSFGLKFTNFLQIGAQRFVGPAGAFNAPNPVDFNKWHLVLQVAP